MQSDVFFFIAILSFFFVMWLAGGGPTKPISFAGPYITPITDTGQTQQGYGGTNWVTGIKLNGTLPSVKQSEIRSSVASAQYQLADLQKAVNKDNLIGQKSPLYGQVRITGGNPTATDPDLEYLTIQVSSSATSDVTLTGWRLQSVATDYGATIRTGNSLPTGADVNDSERIVLHPGDQAYVVTGESPISGSFKENMCTGYLASSGTFYPSLVNRCPVASEEFARFFEGNSIRDEGCYTLMQRTGICRTPSDSGRISSYCLSLIDKRLGYNGCVATHKNDAYFSTGAWRIYLGRTEITRTHDEKSVYGELWRQSREGIKLLDQNGLTVDLYTY